MNRNIRIIGVQAEGAPAIYESYHANSVMKSNKVSTIAEGIAVKEPGSLTLPVIREYVDDIVTVTDEQIASAIVYMLERNKTLMEGAGAAALAALFAHNDKIKSRHCGVIVSGGNLDIGAMSNIQQLAEQKNPKKEKAYMAL